MNGFKKILGKEKVYCSGGLASSQAHASGPAVLNLWPIYEERGEGSAMVAADSERPNHTAASNQVGREAHLLDHGSAVMQFLGFGGLGRFEGAS
jgi:hypothetical protein